MSEVALSPYRAQATLEVPDTTASARLKLIALTVVLSTGAYVINAWAGWGWPLALGVAVLLDALLLWHIRRWNDDALARVAVLGLVAGLVIPASDWYCIRYAGLVYEPGGPFIALSPLYIPLSFVPAVAQLAGGTWALERRVGFGMAVTAIALGGSCYVPLYEYLAKAGHLWSYQHVTMLFDTVPHYIIFDEFLLSLAAPFFARAALRGSWRRVVPLGLGFGAWIVLGIVLGHRLFGEFPQEHLR